ncbi:MAG: type II toxin-antitoxin system VapC family toxin [Bacillota bacterium]
MICYLDTSALVKLYVQEEGSDEVRSLVNDSILIATCKIAFAEARAAFARGYRERAIEQHDYQQIISSFLNDWYRYFVLEISDTLVLLAGDLAEKHQLRGFDAIHLAAAFIFAQQVKKQITVSCWDTRLWKAFQAYNFPLLPSGLAD